MDIDIKGLHDSREIKAGDILYVFRDFIRIIHIYAQRLSNRVLALIVEKDIEAPEDIAVIRVSNSRKALAKISKFYGNPTQNINIIRITGTNGKTTITHLLQNIFESVGFTAVDWNDCLQNFRKDISC